MLLKPFSARAALKPATAASRAGWLTICVMPILYALLVSALALGLLELLELSELPPQPATTPARATMASSVMSGINLNARGIVLLSTTDECAILVRAASPAQGPSLIFIQCLRAEKMDHGSRHRGRGHTVF